MIQFNGKVLLAYITAGFPGIEFTQKAILKLQEAGVSAIELGIPYTDPVADGPAIALASQKSLSKGTNMDIIFKAVQEIKKDVSIPLYLMSYYSPIFTYGHEKYIDNCVKSGISGSILPDITYDEGKALCDMHKKAGIDPVLLAFPNTPDERLKNIAQNTGSFIYYVNLFGTTGVANKIPLDAYEKITHVKKATGKKVCSGFGVNTKEDFNKLSGYADGVIIGSAFVKILLKHENDESKALTDLETFAKSVLS